MSKYQWGSARKARRVADLVRGQSVGNALNILHFSQAAASTSIEKTVRSAMANLLEREEAARLNEEDVVIAEIAVNEGPTHKRIRARAMGRAFRIRKRTCHISVELSAEVEGQEV